MSVFKKGHSRQQEPDEMQASPAVLLPHLRLAGAVMLRAFEDLSTGPDDLALDALLWLASDDAPVFSAALELQNDPLTPISAGKVKRRKDKR